jgi:hydroxyacylglutathione hydrolase
VEIARFTGPPVDTHTYLVADPATREAWVVDAPLDTAASVLAHAADQGFRPTRLVLTHAHFDHILDAERYRDAGLAVALHPAERSLLRAPQTAMFGLPLPMPQFEPDEELAEGHCLRLGETAFEVRHTPGHSPGHVILHCAAESLVLGGDLLFSGGYGRVDLPGSDAAAMGRSLLRLLKLPRDTRILPGHGPETTLGAERRWLRETAAALAGVPPTPI